MNPIGMSLEATLAHLAAKRPPSAVPEPCPYCKGSGVILTWRVIRGQQVSFSAACQCRAPQPLADDQVIDALIKAGAPRGWARMAVEKWEQRFTVTVNKKSITVEAPGLVEVKAWLEGPRDIPLVLVGPPGTGKTKAAMMIAAKQIRERKAVAVRVADDLPSALWHPDTGHAERVHLEKVALLVVDDLHRLLDREAPFAAVSDLLCKRIADEKPTVITLNGEASLSTITDSRLLSRIRPGAVFFDTAKDLRAVKAASKKGEP